ncbi:pseudouridine synthase [Aquisalimonas lutea]|uniref:pseudouridine synthase n=1 Tax=Aquisalimonas lutea TaxID=1327750 RepID=UPI0025B31209|nr:pseudouridine synthase [Aquisalimonas lutea]MDN3518192.1 pseudouridine synthase [Aquisalimonas lutea]
MTTSAGEPLDILYRDDDLIAVDKPSGLLVHRTHLSTDNDAVLQRLRDQIGRRVNPVHRLDRPASGVLLFAFTAETTRALQAAFDDGRVAKRYLALVRGHTEAGGTIDYPVRKARHKPAQPAVTRYRRLRTAEAPFPAGPYATARYSLMRAEPLTGRLHQLRRHFAHIRHPIIGDTTHGDGHQNRAFREHFGIRRLMLMARSLELPHPRHGDTVTITAPLPGAFTDVVRALGWPAVPDAEAD